MHAFCFLSCCILWLTAPLTVINSDLPSQLVPVMLGLNPGPHLAWQRYAPTVLTHCWL